MNKIALEPDYALAVRTVARVREALTHRDTACVAQVLKVVQEMSNKAEDLSVQDLAELICRDLTTVAKIMRAANCLGYNPSAVDVTTLPEAISVIGFETIRNLVISLLLMENAEKRFGADESHDVAAVALSSAMTTQAIAQRMSGLNPEQAFVCGALRHYGKLLLSTFLPDEFLDAQELAKERPVDGAYQEVFGLTPLELGRRILSESNLSKVIQHALEPALPDMIRSKKLNDADKLIVISDFSAKLCELLDEPELSTKSYQAGVEQLLKNYSSSLALEQDDLKEIIAQVSRMMNSVGRAQGFQSFASPIVNRLELIAAGRPLESARRVSATTDGTSDEARASAADPLVIGLAEVERLIGVAPVDARKVFTVAARAVKAGLRLRSCLVFLQEPDSPLFAAAVGAGPMFHEIRNQPLIDPGHRDVFTVCIARGEDVLIKNPDDATIAPFIPGWFRGSVSKGSMALLPVKDLDGTFAMICGVVGMAERIELTGPRLQQLKKLRGYLGMLREAGFERRSAA